MQQTYTILPLEKGETPPKAARGLTCVLHGTHPRTFLETEILRKHVVPQSGIDERRNNMPP